MRSSKRALLSLLLCRAATPVGSLSAAEAWPWDWMAARLALPRVPDDEAVDGPGAARAAADFIPAAENVSGSSENASEVEVGVEGVENVPGSPAENASEVEDGDEGVENVSGSPAENASEVGYETGAAAGAVQRAARAAGGGGTVRRPTRVGCYMRMPSGCPKRPDMETQLWRHDPWAEKDGLDEARCLEREAVWNGFCGSQDATMAFVLPWRSSSRGEHTASSRGAAPLPLPFLILFPLLFS